MTTTRTTRIAAALAAGLATGAFALTTAPTATADDVIAAAAAEPIAADVTATHVPTARASRPRQVVVTNHDGRSVTLYAKGEQIRRVLSPGSKPAVFSGLTPGRTYTVAIGSVPIGTVVALDAPTAASGLTVRSTSTPGTVSLSWRHTPTATTGGSRIAYDVTARSAVAPVITASVVGARTTTLTGLSPDTLYTFTVVPRNDAGRGRATSASMTKPLGPGPAPAATPTVEKPAPAQAAPAPTAAPAPAPAPAPATRSVQRCASGFTELPSGLCQKSQPYTFAVKAYTYTWGVVGSHSVPDEYAADLAMSTGTLCPWGGSYVPPGTCRGATSHSVDDYGWVKDAAPAGWTDDGTQWTKKDAAPVGYTDDGTQWVLVAPKETVVVPA